GRGDTVVFPAAAYPTYELGAVLVGAAEATDAHAYPQVAGTPALREAIADWYGRRQGVTLTPDQVLPTIGSKEFIAGLALWLGLGRGDTVVFPAAAYPTYELGAVLVGA
ncbi:aminotransferase class I/II-fold pyridoxal phosphate-dependent enzyme, partial [Curtobacterium sp. CT11-45]|uniref:aminotransferase class I/II-fold pyridoxal phosphate-dependent enzyme n=1 Tax=Curtobacterium sp. CT11-45 TaxID=3243037 RepID=UPI0039AF0D17